ncbi:MAG: DNA translocase FtsK 4TM domain-containing protein [bacterium]
MDSLKQRLVQEILGVVFFALALFILLSLLSYHPQDPSFSSVGSYAVHNLMGSFGAWLADHLVIIIGGVAFLIPLVLIFWGWRMITLRGWNHSFSQWLGILLLLPSTCGLLSLILGGLNGETFAGFRHGGLTGYLVINSLQMVSSFGTLGTFIILLTMFSISLILLTQVSVLDLILPLPSLVVQAVTFLWDRVRGSRGSEDKPSSHGKKDKKQSKKSPGKGKRKEKQSQADEEDAFEEILSGPKGALPPLSLLEQTQKTETAESKQWIQDSCRKLEEKLLNFAVQGKVVQVLPGPVVTRYEFEPAPGVKISKIANLSDDLALAMKALSVRIVAPVPGKSVVGLEIPNQQREVVYLREILESEQFTKANSRLTLALGKDIAGTPYVTDLARMPHLLIAGATGSGKSVAINALICSILFNATPDEVKFIMIDPKMLELGVYNDIPHLLTPVVVEPKEAASALRWATQEMENRYRILADRGVRNIGQYNHQVLSEDKKPSPPAPEGSPEESPAGILHHSPLPYIVIVIDEFADLMIMSAREVETLLIRLAQMARAVGIHLIIATQRPSVDVVTGLIKANFPSRISFRVSSKTDSRTILDANGAEKLLGLGDMLFLPPGSSDLVRLHGSSITEGEIKRLVKYLASQGKPEYDDTILSFCGDDAKPGSKQDEEEYDDLYDKAVDLVIKTRQASISMIQRRLRIGYNRAARMIELMERDGVVSKPQGSKPREVLIGRDYEK